MNIPKLGPNITIPITVPIPIDQGISVKRVITIIIANERISHIVLSHETLMESFL